MTDKHIKKIILWTIVIAYTLWIFHNSAQTGKVSANLSQTLSYRIYDSSQFLHSCHSNFSIRSFVNFAHFSEYALLGILVSTVSSHTIEERQQKLVIILWMILVPILDEGIQCFTPGRSAELRDCIIDMCGFGFGFLITYLNKKSGNQISSPLFLY